jgi:UDP-xylose/UDP-N-acetylglucosamine transporter B4
MLTGIYVLGKRYTLTKYLSVILVTLGILICTYASGKTIITENDSSGTGGGISDWTIGVGLLTLSLILSARMGVYQEQIYTKWGKHHKEALFYTVFYSDPQCSE